jgi:MFS family permease
MKFFDLNKHFPSYGVRNIRIYYIVTVLLSAWFQIGNWLLYALLYMSTGTFAVYEAFAFGLGILVEIPSGAFADLFGRKRTVLIGAFMQAFGTALFTLGFLDNSLFLIGNTLIIVSFAFRSGAEDALVYDSLEEAGMEEHFDEIKGKARSLTSLSIVIASILGGIGWAISIYLPWTLTAIVFTIGFLVSFKYVEPKIEPEKLTVKNFLLQNKKGFHYLFKSNFRKYTLSFALISGSFLMWHAGIIRVLMGRGFGYDGQYISYLIAITSLFGFLAAFHFRSIRRKLGDKVGFSLVIFMSAISWLATAILPSSLVLGFLVFFGITIGGILAEVWSSVILNQHVHSKDRATAISTLSFLVQIPYVVIVILFGQLINRLHLLLPRRI